MGPDVFTNLRPAPQDGYILLFDALNTPLADQAYVRREMLKYLNTLPPGVREVVL